jgi:hypothetical protein
MNKKDLTVYYLVNLFHFDTFQTRDQISVSCCPFKRNEIPFNMFQKISEQRDYLYMNIKRDLPAAVNYCSLNGWMGNFRHWLVIYSEGNVEKVATRYTEPIRAVGINVVEELCNPIQRKSSNSVVCSMRFNVGWTPGLQIRISTRTWMFLCNFVTVQQPAQIRKNSSFQMH